MTDESNRRKQVPGKRGGDAESHRRSAEGAKALRDARKTTPDQRLEESIKDLEKTIDEVLGKEKK